MKDPFPIKTYTQLAAILLWMVMGLVACQGPSSINDESHCNLQGTIWKRLQPPVTGMGITGVNPDTMIFQRFSLGKIRGEGHFWQFSEESGREVWEYDYTPPFPPPPAEANALINGESASTGYGPYWISHDTLGILHIDTLVFKIEACNDFMLKVLRIKGDMGSPMRNKMREWDAQRKR